MNSINEKLVHAAYVGDLNRVKLILEKGVDCDCVDDKNYTSLMRAKTFAITRFLLKCGANPNYKGGGGYTALMLVRSASQARILLEMGADPNMQNNDGYTALMIFSEMGNKEIVKLLLKNKANVHIRSHPPGDASAFLNALCEGHLEILNLLIKYGVNIKKENKILHYNTLERLVDIAPSVRIRKFVEKHLLLVKNKKT